MDASSRLSRVELSEKNERRRIISVRQAAEIKGVSYDTFRRHYKNLIRNLSTRRRGVRLGDVLED
jgi:hypothetical protein